MNWDRLMTYSVIVCAMLTTAVVVFDAVHEFGYLYHLCLP